MSNCLLLGSLFILMIICELSSKSKDKDETR